MLTAIGATTRIISGGIGIVCAATTRREKAEENEQETDLRQKTRQPACDHRELHQRDVAIAHMDDLVGQDPLRLTEGHPAHQRCR